MNNNFYAMLSRMKYINRWALMRNTRNENLCEHSFEVAYIAHSLSVIGNKRLGKNYDCGEVTLAALYHDVPEVLTGDMPTPVKYHNDEIETAFKKVEAAAADKLISMIPDDLSEHYSSLLRCKDPEIKKLIKAADKISALIKCAEEMKVGNGEFSSAKAAAEKALKNLDCEEANIFLAEFLPAFYLTLDEQTV